MLQFVQTVLNLYILAKLKDNACSVILLFKVAINAIANKMELFAYNAKEILFQQLIKNNARFALKL